MRGFFYLFSSSIKSLKCNRSADTEMLISQNEIPREMSKVNKLAPKR